MGMTIGDMLEMQEKLYKAYGEPFGWMDYTPKNAAMHWLYMLGEAGEVVDALKKNSLDQLMQEGEPRRHLVEEMADTMMFFADTMACMGVSAEEFSKVYREKHEKNMNRWKR